MKNGVYYAGRLDYQSDQTHIMGYVENGALNKITDQSVLPVTYSNGVLTVSKPNTSWIGNYTLYFFISN